MFSQSNLVRGRVVALGLFIAFAGDVSAQASTFDLSADFSYTSNPNGAWSFVYAGSPLSNVGAPLSNGNSGIPTIGSGGYYSSGNNLDQNTPDVIKSVVDGPSASGAQGTYTLGDFKKGDVIVHSPSDGLPVEIIWTAPSNGTISFTTDLWYAHTLTGGLVIQRTNVDSVSLGGTVLGSADVGYLSNTDRSSPWTVTKNSLSVTAGEQLIVSLQKAPGENYGTLNGVAISGTFNAAGGVPETSTWAMMLMGFAGAGLAAYRRNKTVRFPA
ncbi:hypothetical protein [uncultured Rhodoblastus sp.]|uniref:hypothetical protein n=1 Tax=uncultured Rhodoblastus sp. TaxID=543037 RepID=UPI0025D93723|nr:hypothetical protein [uncultured Rhodoblastus sp.]